MARDLFGTDGVRGVANREITCELALAIGRAATVWVGPQARAPKHPRVLIGRDTRRSGAMLEASLSAGISSVGGEPVSLGIIPTPAVSMLMGLERADLGVVISASHNPFHDNGIKLFGPRGTKLTDAEEEAIEDLLRVDLKTLVDGDNVGWFSRRSDARVVYAGELVHRLEPLMDDRAKNLNVLIDCANGAAWPAAGVAFSRAGIKADYIGTGADGTNINRGAGSTDLATLQRSVVAGSYDVGIAYDGDADRMIAIDENGDEVDGDAVLGLLAIDLKDKGLLDKNAVVCTTMSNLGLMRTMRDNGITPYSCDVGDRYVIQEMNRRGAVLGGEQSGHMIYAGVQKTGDGIATSLLFLSAIARRQQKLSEAAALIERLPQMLRNVPVGDKTMLPDATAVWDAVKEAQRELGESGRVVLRASGTEPLVRVMVEAEDDATCTQILDRLCAVVEQELSGDAAAR